ncbi:MAG: hypothetical protein RMJ37_02765 [Spirochaetia bacterium]|nr:hypothetical protein [Spirochaetota bacterium]MCX8095914.1 hypothetical protein [Spirochaetota bacterium]MDW8112250.1 hypothetical protein [Spirochaetia bacterium]
MTDKERVELIRKGNQLFNEGKIEDASKIFLATNYKDGLVRVGDHYLYQEKKFFKAFFYYKKANYSKRLDEIYKKWAEVIHFLLEEDKKISSDEQKLETFDREESYNQGQENQQSSLIKEYNFPKLEHR